MNSLNILGFLSDFGDLDHYVAAMKMAALKHAPELQLLDVCHNIPPQDLYAAAFTLKHCLTDLDLVKSFCCVVDPGVGTKRLPLAVKYKKQYFIGPDNGLFSFLYEEGCEIRVIENEKILARDFGNTFHGRDIFAPAAALLAGEKIRWEEIGRQLEEAPVKLKNFLPAYEGNSICGRIMKSDHFGNLITNIPSEMLRDKTNWKILIAGKTLTFVNTYDNIAVGECAALEGSGGYIEIAANCNSAAAHFNKDSSIRIEF